MKLYGYWRSSAAYRVRIALNLKGIDCELIPVHLVKNGGEQHSESYQKLNPAELVPTLVDGDFVLNQSLAIIDYLEDKPSEFSIYPANSKDKALVKAMAYDIACEVHPLNNLRVQQYLTGELSVNEQQKAQWVNQWMSLGFAAFEQQLARFSGQYCFGDQVSLADICLIPQLYNAKRFGIDLTPYPLINKVDDNCQQLDAFVKALPENQPDAV